MLALQTDPVENQRTRTRQIVELGRYGRQSFLQWDDVELTRFWEYYGALRKVTENEAGLKRTIEDT